MVLGGFSSFVTSIDCYSTLHRSALDTFRVFEDSGVVELLQREKEIRKHTDSFLRVSGMNWSDCGDLERHLDFFERYLKEEKKPSCFSDIEDIVFRDLPTALETLILKSIQKNDLELINPEQDFSAEDSISKVLESFDEVGIQVAWKKALDRKTSDPEGAITISRTLLESVCKNILDEQGIEYNSNKIELPELYKKTAKTLNLSASQHTEGIFRQILSGCSNIIIGLGSLRNRLGDAHGQGRNNIKPAPRHSELAVNLSGSMALYLIETYKSKLKDPNRT